MDGRPLVFVELLAKVEELLQAPTLKRVLTVRSHLAELIPLRLPLLLQLFTILIEVDGSEF